MLYYHGHGVKRNYEKAREYYEKSAALGDVDALHNLGFLYVKGLGVKKDLKKAEDYFRQAAALGCEMAKRSLLILRSEKRSLF